MFNRIEVCGRRAQRLRLPRPLEAEFQSCGVVRSVCTRSMVRTLYYSQQVVGGLFVLTAAQQSSICKHLAHTITVTAVCI